MTTKTEIRAALVARGLIPSETMWTRQTGGRTNQVWRIDFKAQSLICKIYAPSDGNPLYPNFARAEFATLTALQGQDIAPEPLTMFALNGVDVVVYHHLTGHPWREDLSSVAALLARIHAQQAPAILRMLPSGSKALRNQIDAILAECTASLPFERDADGPDIGPTQSPNLIHTDVVASNIVVTQNGPKLIDWQCPALGDPCEDLASFLSPAMQCLYGNPPLSDPEVQTFLDAYPNKNTVQRYRLLAPLFHQRIAAYCLWKSEQGDLDYADAMQLELSAIDHIERHKEHAG